MRRTTVDTKRGRIVCLRNRSTTGQVAIMVNGLVETKERWSPALVHLAREGYDAYAYDHIGQFESEGADDPEGYTVEKLADDLLAVLGKISPERSAHVVGGCFGGFVARHLVARAAQRVRSLVLLGSGPSVARSTAPHIHQDMAGLVARGGITAVFEEVRDQALRAGISERSVQRVRDGYLATRPGFLVGFSRSAAQYPEAVHPEGVPVLVAHGSGDGMWPAPEQRAMARSLSAPTEVIHGAGHSPTVTHPHRTAEVLSSFWNRIDTATSFSEPKLDISLA